MNQIRNARLIPIPDGISETNRPPIVSENSRSVNDEDAYEQWLHNNNTRNPDLNDVYLKELIKQFSDKSRAAHLQNEASFRKGMSKLTEHLTMGELYDTVGKDSKS